MSVWRPNLAEQTGLRRLDLGCKPGLSDPFPRNIQLLNQKPVQNSGVEHGPE
jgi:hypothetical protein